MSLWPWFEIKHLKKVVDELNDDIYELKTLLKLAQKDNARLVHDYQEMKTKEMVTELHRKQLQDKLERFAKFDPDGDGKPGGRRKKKEAIAA